MSDRTPRRKPQRLAEIIQPEIQGAEPMTASIRFQNALCPAILDVLSATGKLTPDLPVRSLPQYSFLEV